MGMLGDQPARGTWDYSLEAEALAVKRISQNTGISVTDLIALRATLEQERATRARIEGGDYHDEQMGGFGEILRELVDQRAPVYGGLPYED